MVTKTLVSNSHRVKHAFLFHVLTQISKNAQKKESGRQQNNRYGHVTATDILLNSELK